MIEHARATNNLYILKQASQNILSFHDHVTTNCFSSCNKVDSHNFDIWHHKFGHQYFTITKHICKQFPNVTIDSNTICEFCHLAKQHKLPVIPNHIKTTTAFELIHMVIWGHISIPYVHGHHYFLTVVDDFSRHSWIFP